MTLRFMALAALIAALVAIQPLSAKAGAISSGAGGGTCTLNSGVSLASGFSAGGCTTVAVTVFPGWQTNNPSPPDYGGVWISYADTGFNGANFQPFAGNTSADWVMKITETFVVAANEVGSLDFFVWADDTAELYFDGVLKKTANFGQDTDPCAIGSIGCEPSEFFNLTMNNLGPGTYTIDMFVYQVGNGDSTATNPFGLLYSGFLTLRTVTSDVPEPASLALLGMGLLGLGLALAIRRRRRN